MSDLRIRVETGRILLSSERLGREVIPRLTSAHNWSTAAQGIYRFLCALQHQGRPSLGFSWGALGSAPFLPRVTHGRLVLALARWNLAADQLAPLGEATGAERYRVVQRLRAELGLPRWVGVADGDNVLPVDLDNVLHVESFARLLKSRESAALVELWGEDALVAESAEARRFACMWRRLDASCGMFAVRRPSRARSSAAMGAMRSERSSSSAKPASSGWSVPTGHESSASSAARSDTGRPRSGLSSVRVEIHRPAHGRTRAPSA